MKDEEKWEIVILYKSNDLSLRAIAKRMNCSLRAVQHIIRNYKETGQVRQLTKSGRPSVMNETALQQLDQLINKNDTAPSSHLAALLQKKTGKRISPRSIRRARVGALQRHPVHDVMTKTLGETEKQNRLSFARQLLTMNLHYILWSDEMQWDITSTGQIHWVKKGYHRPTRDVSTVHASVMVWGCVWHSGKSELCICERTIDAAYYTEILRDYLLPAMPCSTRYLFQQDNARPHTAAKTMNWMSQFAVKLLENWPTYSPDLNPIEHVWSWMTAFIKKEAPTNRQSLVNAILLAWEKIPQSVIQGYIGHLNTVCQKIIAANGDHS